MSLRQTQVLAFATAFIVSLVMMTLASLTTVFAAAGTCTWQGDVDNNFSTVGNWGDGGGDDCGDHDTPAAGDTLAFDNVATNKTPNNDIAGLVIASLTFTGSGYTLDGNGFGMSGGGILVGVSGVNTVNNDIGISSSMTIGMSAGAINFMGDINLNSNTLTVGNDSTTVVNIGGVVSGTGGIVRDKPASATGGDLMLSSLTGNTFTGPLMINDGQVFAEHQDALGTAAGATTLTGDSALIFELPSGAATVSEPISLTNAPSTSVHTMQVTGAATSATFTGNMTLGSADVEIGSDKPLTLSGIIDGASGGFTFFDTSGDNSASLTLGGANTYGGTTTTNGLLTVNGTVGAVNILSGGTLKGTNGTVGAVTAQAGGHIAPGNSPGCFSSTGVVFNSTSTFDVEIGGRTVCTEYDQLRVTGGGTVTFGDATLNVSFVNGFTAAAGDTFTIIDVAGSDPNPPGSFNGLAQGATVTVGGVAMTISYTGGDGNDTVLTVPAAGATATPGTPNTGLGLLMANPGLTLLLTLASSTGLFYAARRYGYVPAIVRK